MQLTKDVFWAALDDCREGAGLSKAELCRRAGFDFSQLVPSHRRYPNFSTINSVLQVCGVSKEQFAASVTRHAANA